MFGLGYGEMLMCGVIALILFGAKLPEVARNLGGTYQQLRKHLTDFQREFNSIDKYEPPRKATYEKDEPESTPAANAAPRFIPPPAESDDLSM